LIPLMMVLLAISACGSDSPPTAPTTSAAPYSQQDLVVGTGATANTGNSVNVAYTLWLYDSSKPGAPIARTTLAAGSHRLEFAYREGGARLADNIIIIEDAFNQGEQCSD